MGWWGGVVAHVIIVSALGLGLGLGPGLDNNRSFFFEFETLVPHFRATSINSPAYLKSDISNPIAIYSF